MACWSRRITWVATVSTTRSTAHFVEVAILGGMGHGMASSITSPLAVGASETIAEKAGR